VLLYLDGKDQDTFQEIEDNLDLYYGAVYRSVERLKELKLVKQEISSSTKPPSNIIRLTEKGKHVAEKLKEIEDILQGGYQ
jgi:DNA-binding MarR family transcriptional regulator